MRGGVVLAAGALLPLMVSVSAKAQGPGTHNYRAVPLEGPMPPRLDGSADSSPEVGWYTIDGGGTTMFGPNGLRLDCTTGQPDAGIVGGEGPMLLGGFWPLPDGGAPCYANCDGSTVQPILNVNDFQCFLNLYAAEDARANCDGSTVAPVLNINDFQCFVNAYAVGCT
jgi:hypothetical protein